MVKCCPDPSLNDEKHFYWEATSLSASIKGEVAFLYVNIKGRTQSQVLIEVREPSNLVTTSSNLAFFLKGPSSFFNEKY